MSVNFDSNVQLTVKIGFDSEPLDSSQSYTDISAYVRGITSKRGRVNELGTFAAGTLSVLLDNTDNRFNPTQTTHYYDSGNARTKIQPLKRIKIEAIYDSTTYPLYEGFLNNIPVKFPGEGHDSTVTFTAVDAFKIFQSQTLQAIGWKMGKSGFSELGTSTRLSYVDEQELSSARITRLLNAVGWPSAQRDINAGTYQVQTQAVTDNLLTAMRECEEAENAQLFVAKDGDVTFRNRDYKLSNTLAINSQATFSNDGSNLPYQDVIVSFDDNEVVNVYEWKMVGGATQYTADADSVNRYTAKDSTETTINISNANVLSIIEQKLSETAIPIERIEKLRVKPQQNTSIWPQALGREIGDRITVKIQNPNGTTFTDELWIESINHQINAAQQSWTWTVSLSPASSSAWVLGQAKLGVGTRFAYA